MAGLTVVLEAVMLGNIAFQRYETLRPFKAEWLTQNFNLKKNRLTAILPCHGQITSHSPNTLKTAFSILCS